MSHNELSEVILDVLKKSSVVKDYGILNSEISRLGDKVTKQVINHFDQKDKEVNSTGNNEG